MSLRNERVRKALMREISDILRTEIKDPNIAGIVSITDVAVSPDNSAARVFYSVFGDEATKDKTRAALERDTARIRHAVGQRIRLRHTPSLLFILDESLERGAKITQLIDKISRGEIK